MGAAAHCQTGKTNPMLRTPFALVAFVLSLLVAAPAMAQGEVVQQRQKDDEVITRLILKLNRDFEKVFNY